MDVEQSVVGFSEHLYGSFDISQLKVPTSSTSSNAAISTLYYSPVLNNFRRTPPPKSDVRGGFLCEMMGLGKTIETIALIIKNPRPSTSQLSNITGASPAAAVAISSSSDISSSSSAKIVRPIPPMDTGTVVRGGTLVVCNVSLVGQWQSELRKVINSDAQLKVHQYHGSKRLKNAAVSLKSSLGTFTATP